jgi:hypothetical protein
MEPRTVNHLTQQRRSSRVGRAIAAALVTALGALALVVVAPVAAQAATSDVSATCTTLDVKLRTFAEKGAVSILVNGEYQTVGDEAGWQSVGTSFTRSYAFEPVVAHSYTVRVNAFDGASGGASFAPGTGADAEYVASTVPCSPVSVSAVGSSCVSDKRVDKQTLSLEIRGLRAKVTYLVEVLDENGEVADHFQFRTAPVVNKTFSGLTAGQTYRVRVSDQTNDVLSGGTTTTLVGCAAPVSLENVGASCVGGTGRISADVEGLVPGRSYGATLAPVGKSLTLTPATSTGVITFAGVTRGDYLLTLDDDDAPLSARASVTVADCATGSGSGGTAGSGTGSTDGGSSSGQSATGGASTGSTTTRPGGGRSSATGGESSISATFSEAVTLGLSPVVSADGTVQNSVDTSDAAGPGDDDSYASGSGSVADELSSAPASNAWGLWDWMIVAAGLLAAFLLIVLALLRRRRRAD